MAKKVKNDQFEEKNQKSFKIRRWKLYENPVAKFRNVTIYFDSLLGAAVIQGPKSGQIRPRYGQIKDIHWLFF